MKKDKVIRCGGLFPGKMTGRFIQAQYFVLEQNKNVAILFQTPEKRDAEFNNIKALLYGLNTIQIDDENKKIT